jgi:hypothetical protein
MKVIVKKILLWRARICRYDDICGLVIYNCFNLSKFIGLFTKKC